MEISAHAESATQTVRLREVSLAAIADICSPAPDGFDTFGSGHARGWRRALEACTREPLPDDRRLLTLASDLDLLWIELLTVALAAAVEDDPLVGRTIARAQAPLGGSRPTLGLLARAFASACPSGQSPLALLLDGQAVKTGLLSAAGENLPLAERSVMVPAPLCLALAGGESGWPGTTVGVGEDSRIPLPDSMLACARDHAAALDGNEQRVLIVRTGLPAEGRSVATVIAGALGKTPLFIETSAATGLGPWLVLGHFLPVFCCELAPGERRRLPSLAGYRGPVLIVSGPDGSIESQLTLEWTLPVPPRNERRALWSLALADAHRDDSALADLLARDHRHSAGRIAHLGRLAWHHAALTGHTTPDRDDVIAASWSEGGLDSFAEPLRTHVPDDALVVAAPLRAELDTLMLRCRLRESLADGLGPSATTRYRPGIKALFTGPSGTGKTLACGWIATRLGLPLYRVDLASLTSKYVGETEKNLSQLLARAEQAEVILLFDEADSLFGKRTAINDANDRYANAQTNYLLQRIEHYDGIVFLTSNSQARFDSAFARRLDLVLEFPMPGPEERRRLWQAHLGPATPIVDAELNRLAVLLDLSGGHIRNVVLAAAVRARRDQRTIAYQDILHALEGELRKLGRQVPLDLNHAYPGTTRPAAP